MPADGGATVVRTSRRHRISSTVTSARRDRIRLWAADVTQFRTDEGWLHLAGGHRLVVAACRRLVDEHVTQQRARHRRVGHGVRTTSTRPPGRAPQRPRRRLHVARVLPTSRRHSSSTSRSVPPATATTTPPSKSFWATLKRELAWIHDTTTWPTRAELRSALFDYIEGFYNPNRIQRRLGHHSPVDYEATLSRLKPVSTKAGQLQCDRLNVRCP